MRSTSLQALKLAEATAKEKANELVDAQEQLHRERREHAQQLDSAVEAQALSQDVLARVPTRGRGDFTAWASVVAPDGDERLLASLVLSGRFRYQDWHDQITLKEVLGEATHATQLDEDNLQLLSLARLASLGVPREAWESAGWSAMRLFEHGVSLSDLFIAGFVLRDFSTSIPPTSLCGDETLVYLLARAGADISAIYKGSCELLVSSARRSISAGYQVTPEQLKSWGLEPSEFADDVRRISSVRAANKSQMPTGATGWVPRGCVDTD